MTLYYLSLIGFFGIFSTTISKNPALPLFAQSLGADPSLLGLLSALSPLAGILFSFPVGLLADSWGKKRLLVISSFIFLSAPLLYLLVQNPWQLLPIRFFHGLATAILGPVAAAIISSRYQKNRGQNLGWYSSATLVGRTLAPIIGGIIIASLNFKAVYIAAFILAVPVVVLSVFIRDNSVRARRVNLIRSLAGFISHRILLMTSLVEMAIYFIFGVFETYLPVYLALHQVSVSRIGLLFSLQILVIAVSKPLFGKLADTVDKKYQIILGLVILSLAMGMIPFFPSFSLLVVISIIFGLGMSISTIATSAYIADLSPRRELTRNMGALSSIMDIGQTFGPLLIGLLITAFSYRLGILVSAGLGLVIALMFSGTPSRRR